MRIPANSTKIIFTCLSALMCLSALSSELSSHAGEVDPVSGLTLKLPPEVSTADDRSPQIVPTAQQDFDLSLGDLLNENGRIVLPDDFSGSIDPAGFEMVSADGEEPRFAAASESAGTWSDGEFGIAGCNGLVRTVFALNGEVFLGGDFTTCGDAETANIARFDPSTGSYSALGSGTDSSVYSLVAIGTELYVGGDFLTAGGGNAQRIAVYDTTQTGDAGWSPLGGGVNDVVLELVAIGTKLYVGGVFDVAGGGGAQHIAVYDTTQAGDAGWDTLGAGVSDRVTALTAVDTDLYVGGLFSTAGGSSANHIAVYDTTMTGDAGWGTLGAGANGAVTVLAAVDTDLYVGGGFSTAGGNGASRIAVYDTTQSGDAGWSTLGSGVDDWVWALTAIGTDLYVGGYFVVAGGINVNYIAVYDTTQTGDAGWNPLGGGLNYYVYALEAIGTNLFVGGWFNRQANGSGYRFSAKCFALYDTTQAGGAGWSALGGGLNDNVYALAAIGTDLYVGGLFQSAGGRSVNRIALYDTTRSGETAWRSLGSGVGGDYSSVTALAVKGTDLYVGGTFTSAGGVSANNVAVYDTTQIGDAGWSPLGSGVGGGIGVGASVDALIFDGTDLYVGGNFTTAGGSSANNIAVYDTTQSGDAAWSTLGSGLDEPVYAMAFISPNLYVGGSFILAGAGYAIYIAAYDTTQTGDAGWRSIGSGAANTVWSMVANGTDVYVGGAFNSVGNADANRIAVYDTSLPGDLGWSALGSGLDGTGIFKLVDAMTIRGTHLYVGGRFTTAGGNSANNIAVYDIRQSGDAGWATLGSGVNGDVTALSVIGTDLFACGYFTIAGGKTNEYCGRYDLDPGSIFSDGFERP